MRVRLRHLVPLNLAICLLVLFTGIDSVAADATGCTAAPGPFPSSVCGGTGFGSQGLAVTTGYASYASPENICAYQGRNTGQRLNATYRTTWTHSFRAGCGFLIVSSSVGVLAYMVPGSKFCGTMRSNLSNGAFPSPACVTIKML